MFTGIITDVGEVKSIGKNPRSIDLVIETSFAESSMGLGASICCSGCCLTVTEKGNSGKKSWFRANASQETLDKTNLKFWKTGRKINLEKSLKLGDELGGHIVFGHVDGLAEIISVQEVGDSKLLKIFFAPEYKKFIAEKGSVALDGVSLTINKTEDSAAELNIIPHTWQHTSFKYTKVGDFLNFEIDMLARYVGKNLEK